MAIELGISEQIVEILYKYIKTIDVGIPWSFEFLAKQPPSLAFKQMSVPVKTTQYITGGYIAQIPFNIYYKGDVTDTRSALDMTLPLNKLASYFDSEKEKVKAGETAYVGLNLPTGYEIINLEMTSTPEDITGNENNEAVYFASFVFEFRKKSTLT